MTKTPRLISVWCCYDDHAYCASIVIGTKGGVYPCRCACHRRQQHQELARLRQRGRWVPLSEAHIERARAGDLLEPAAS